jgi:catechol 2,3-dioxygenase-like lactoylglutathione lyase family enzyme
VTVYRIVPDFQSDEPIASAGFYRDVLGLEVAMDQGWIVTFADPDDPSVQLSVVSRDATASIDADVSIEVDDVEAIYGLAVRSGFEIVHPLTDEPWGVRRFFVRDPTGKVVNVLQHRDDDRDFGRTGQERAID